MNEISVTPDRRVSSWWRALAIFLLLVLLIAWAAAESLRVQLTAQVSHLQQRISQQPALRHVSVLMDTQQTPAMLITAQQGGGVLQIQRLNEVREGREESMQVWALAPNKPPLSLGVIQSKYPTLELAFDAAGLEGATELAISAENKGGVSQERGPSLPWLFRGALVQKSL
jgi:anti-sigma-K factor RskA